MLSRQARKFCSLLLLLSLLLSLSILPAHAASGAEVKFTFPEDTYSDTSGVTIDVYKGIFTYGDTPVETYVKNGTLTLVGADATRKPCTILEPGYYTYYIHGDNCYRIYKLFIVTQEDIASGTISLEATGGNLAGTGYEPTTIPPLAYEGYEVFEWEAGLGEWTDEIMEKVLSIEDQGYQTPAFTTQGAVHQITTQDELMTFLKDRDASCDEMYLYTIGETPGYHFDMSLAIFTQTDLSQCTTLEQAAKAVTANGKTNVWIQAQIHANENASGEGALVVIDDIVNDPEIQSYLDDINILIVPRINLDGSYLYTRSNYEDFDMNRDHMAVKAEEISFLHNAYFQFMPEIAVDLHEMDWYGVASGTDYMRNADDVQVTPATSLNIDPAVTELALDMTAAAFQSAKDEGLRPYHYGTTVNNPIGRAYYGLFNSASLLVETRGIGAGQNGLERRVFSQETIVLSFLEYAAQHAAEIKTLVADARADVVAEGSVFGEDEDILVLHHTKSGNTLTEFTGLREQYYLDGTLYTSHEDPLSLEDTVTRSRQRPTAYVIPKDIANVDQILYVLDNQNIEYYSLLPGSTAELKQYYYVGEYSGEVAGTYGDGGGVITDGFVADLRDAEQVTFDSGAYVIPMDQVSANVVGMLFEPDVNDSTNYDGTLVQYGLVTYDKDSQNFPIYRYEKDNPRTTLVSNGFADISGHWAKDAILYAASKGLMNGTSANVFSPDMNLSRSMIAQILYSLEGKPALAQADLEKKFSDVASDAWYANAVYWAQSKGIISGYGDGAFGPNDPVTREQLAAILSSYSKFKGMDVASKGSLSAFPDSASASSWAVQSLTWAVEKGLLSGMGDGTLNPTGTASRGQVAQIMMTYLEKVAK